MRSLRRRIALMVPAVVLVMGSMVAIAPPVSAAPAWSVTPTPDLHNTTEAELEGVSCPSAQSCFAVGHWLPPNGVAKQLFEHWDGSSWAIISGPFQNGRTSRLLSAVSCPSSVSCFAVGARSSTATDASALIEHWDGTAWSVMTSPSNAGTMTLSSVSCASASSCFAVGGADVLHWNGSRWSIMKVSHPSGPAFLSAVSCPSVTSCFAVGSSGGLAGVSVIAHWAGTSWSVMPSPESPPMDAVSCANPSNCLAVGSVFTGVHSSPTPVAERWDGSQWSVIASPRRTGAPIQVADAVSCSGPNACVAVGASGFGSFGSGPPDFKSLVESWDGSRWSIVPSSNQPGAVDTHLNAVACPEPANCFAVGGSTALNEQGHTVAARGPIAIAPSPPIVGVAASGAGRWLVASDGGVFSFGDAKFYGSTGAMHLNQPIVGMAATRSRHGYWLVASDGGIFSFGDARFYGSTGAMHLNQPIVGMAATRTGRGYWLVASDGGVFSFGDARFYGSTGAMHLNQPIVGMARTRSGNGYSLVASDGGMFTFGDAPFYGSTGAMRLNKPIVGMATTKSGGGYWLVASDGGIFTFGDAHFYGSAAFQILNDPIIGMSADEIGRHYEVVTSGGELFAF
jgi:hypothetical protein